MAAVFHPMRSQTPNQSGSWACASAPLCSAANSRSRGRQAKAPASRSKSRSAEAPGLPKHNPMKILIADDHAVVRHGLKQILADDFKRADFGEASTGQEALSKIWNEHWDVVVL